MFKKPFLLLFAIVLLFALFHPRFKPAVFPGTQKQLLSEYTKSLKNNTSFNAAGFWHFREFYSNGSFVFQREPFSKELYRTTLQQCTITLKKSSTAFLIYRSGEINSVEFLTDIKSLQKTVMLKTPPRKYLSQNKDNFVYYTADRLCIVFLKDTATLRATNGFLDYKERDKELVGNKNWLVIAAINFNK